MKAVRVLVLTALLVSLALPALARPRFHLGGVVVGGGYSHFSGPYYPYYYDPFFYGPSFAGPWGYPYGYGWGAYGSGLYGLNVQAPNKGEVRLKSGYPEAEVYIDGAYAGTVKKLHTMWMDPGAYDVEVRPANQAAEQKRVYVLSGKTLDVKLAEVRR